MTTKKNITITQRVLPVYRAVSFGNACDKRADVIGEWHLTEDDAVSDIETLLLDRGTGTYCEIEQVYMTESTLNKIVAELEEA